MTRIWVRADDHFRHTKILTFKDDKGELIRGKVFKDVNEHDEMLVKWHNELVKPEDHVYFLGDVAINKGGLRYVARMNGHKRLVRGNHDIFEDKLYHEAGLKKILGVRVWPKHNLIFSHIPLHPDCLSGRGWKNIHGHLHSNRVLKNKHIVDEAYECVSLEHTNYRPKLIME